MRRGLLILLVLALLPLPALAQKIVIDYDKSADLSKYETWAWYPTEDTSVLDTSPFVHQKILAAIEETLLQGELKKAADDPDLYFTYHTNEQEEMRLNTTHFGYGYGPGWYWDPYWAWGGGMSTSTTTAYTYTQGTLIIDAWDAETEQLVWRGSATAVVPENPEKFDKKLRQALAKMLKKWERMYRKDQN